MNIFQKIGMALFIVSCAILLSVLFMNRFKLTNENLGRAVNDKKELAHLSPILEPMMDKSYTFSFGFNKDLGHYFEIANEDAQSKYEVTDEDIDHIISQFPKENLQYNNEKLGQAFENNDIGKYKKEKFKSYTSYLNGREFESSKQLRNELKNTASNISGSIPKDKGFESYKIKTLKLTLTRAASYGPLENNTLLWFCLTIGLGIVGAFIYILPKFSLLPGIKNDGIFHSSNSGRGWIGYIIGAIFILFYIMLYWYPEYMTSWMIIVDPVSKKLNGGQASQWFFYGFLYTVAIAVMGVRMFIKYRHSKYHIIRTASVIFFQTAFAFLIPEILILLNKPSMDLKNIWPLNYSFFFDYNIENLTNSGGLGFFMLVWGIILIVIAVPVITYFYGKRWYCSWVCGCGGLAETLGDPYRQLSDKSLKAWKIERWMVHGVLVFAVVMTAGTLYTYFSGSGSLIGIDTYWIRSTYGFLIGSIFAGVVGVGFYPFMGSRVWCRFGCPLAAYLGIVQRFKSRFRITTNGGQCISCGNCSTYCEMGIDVRAYAQRGQNIIRASCVGCGVCSSVCPRGVLNLENKDPKGRFNEPILIGNEAVTLQD